MLQTIINTFTSFFSRGFWFGSFLPVLIVAFLHAILAAIVFAPTWLSLDAVLTLGTEAGAKMTLLFALLVVAAYVLTPFVPLLRGVIDGSLLPRWFHDALRNGRRGPWREASEAFRVARNASVTADRLVRDIPELAKKRGAAVDLLPIDDAVAFKAAEDTIQAAEKAVRELTQARWPDLQKKGWLKRWWWRRFEKTTPDLQKFKSVVLALGNAFSSYSQASMRTGVPDDLARRLDAVHVRYVILIKERAGEKRHLFETEGRRNPNLDLIGWQATRLGDVRRATETYSQDTYGADYEWLWPRLAIVLPEQDTGLARRVIDVNAQLNFAILLIALFQTIPVVWLPILFVTAEKLWLLLLVGWLVPILNLGLYELVVQSQAAFGSIVATAIDRHRVELLTALHQALPPTLSAERELWTKLSRAREPDMRVELTYTRPVRA